MNLKKIIKPDDFANQISENLKKKLGAKVFKLGYIRDNDNHIISIVAADNAERIFDSENQRSEYVIPIAIPKNDEPFWLGYSLVLKNNPGKTNYYLFHIGIRIFKGRFTEEEKKKVFRAEWMIDEKNTKHAQPHWHVHSMIKQSAFTFEKGAIFEENEEVTEFGSDGLNSTDSDTVIKESKDYLKDFHFAMSAQWNKENTILIHNLDSMNELVLWTEGCLKYIMGQLA